MHDSHGYRTVARIRRDLENRLRGAIEDAVEDHSDEPDLETVCQFLLSAAIDVARWYPVAGTSSPAELGQQYADVVRRMLGLLPVDA